MGSTPKGVAAARDSGIDLTLDGGLDGGVSTYLGLHYHLIFSAKNREPWIVPSVRPRLHEYLGGVIHGLEGEPHGIGGTADHVHLLITLASTHRLSDFVRELKKASSIWMSSEGKCRDFSWQEGYCALTVSPSGRNAVREYIANQEEHHRQFSFQDELRTLLRKHNLEWDERYVWD